LPPQSPQQLINDVIYNQLRDHQHHRFFAYFDNQRTGDRTRLKAEVETRTGRIHRTLGTDGRLLSPDEQVQESRRLQALIHDSGQQQKLRRDYQGDEDRIASIVSLLPSGFIYRFDGVEGNEIRLKSEPNQAFKPPSYEAKVFHGMAGTLWVDAREKRLTRLSGQLVVNVDFGYGLLGRLDKGGSFDMQRVDVAPGSGKTQVLNVHITLPVTLSC